MHTLAERVGVDVYYLQALRDEELKDRGFMRLMLRRHTL